MTMTQFSILLGLYDKDYIHTEEYAQLPIDYPPSLTQGHAFRVMCGDRQYDPRHSKATSLTHPSYRYIHVILSRSVTGHDDSTGVLS